MKILHQFQYHVLSFSHLEDFAISVELKFVFSVELVNSEFGCPMWRVMIQKTINKFAFEK